jgi:hypothetical protein
MAPLHTPGRTLPVAPLKNVGTAWTLPSIAALAGAPEPSEEPGLGRLLALERAMTAKRDHVVSGLIAKRAELAGIIDKLQRQLDQYR